MLLYTQLGFSFKPHSRLSLIIKRTIEATVVKVHSHIDSLVRIMKRILSDSNDIIHSIKVYPTQPYTQEEPPMSDIMLILAC